MRYLTVHFDEKAQNNKNGSFNTMVSRYFKCPTCSHLPTILHHSFSHYLFSLFWPVNKGPLLLFSFSSSHKYKHSSHTLSSSPTGVLPSPPSFFFGKIIGKSLGTSKHLHLLFEVKFLILLVSFIFCLRLYFYLSFNNNTPMIYEH